jgi:hypothetical protein
MLARNIHDEDTVELQLSAEQLAALNQAYAEAEDPEPAAAPVAEHSPAPAAVAPAPAVVSKAVTAVGPPIAANAAVVAVGVSAPAPEPAPAVRRVTAPAVAAAVPAPIVITVVPSPSAAPAALPERTPPKLKIVSPAPAASAPTAPARKGGPRATVGLRIAAALVAVAAVIALLFWPRGRTPEAVTTPTPTPAVSAPLLKPLPESAPPADSEVELPPSPVQPPPMRFANPFDSSEIFEFPAGTSYVDARDQVAQQLLARARERGALRSSPTRGNSLPVNPDHVPNETSFAKQL